MIRNHQDLERLREQGHKSLWPDRGKIVVGTASCGLAAGSRAVARKLDQAAREYELDQEVSGTGCLGFCSQEPLVEVRRADGLRVVYPQVDEARAEELAAGLAQGDLSPELALCRWREASHPTTRYELAAEEIPLQQQIGFYRRQQRVVLRNCGLIDPGSVAEYVSCGGYSGLLAALSTDPENIVETVSRAGLRGRGGAGFPTGRKWGFTRQEPGTRKCVICNADEGDPGAYMDRSILEGDPHSVIEGMAIGAYAIGADEGYIYVRAEYPLAVQRIQEALDQAEELGLLGEGILGSDFSFRLQVKTGAGAFVCGEETALIASIEGRRGMPRPRPPFPAQSGLWGRPTNVNNVETWANVPPILSRGAEWFAETGTSGSSGTKVFSLVGKIKNSGLVEVPMGITIRELVYEVGGGTPDGGRCKAVQTGGPSGGCIPESLFDTPIDFDSLREVGAMMGSGGLVVLGESACMVDMARYFLKFTQGESCGQCPGCRLGTKRMLEILIRITEGRGQEEDLLLLEELATGVREASLCGLGRTAPNPVLTTLRYFKHEYETHVRDRRCPAGVCRALVVYHIDPERCLGCGACRAACPQGAISGEPKKPHTIDPQRCVRCGSCIEACLVEAVKPG